MVHIQKKDPAYTRLKTQFSVESETQTRTTFRPIQKQEDNVSNNISGTLDF